LWICRLRITIYLFSGTYLFLVPENWDSDGWIHEFNSRPQYWQPDILSRVEEKMQSSNVVSDNERNRGPYTKSELFPSWDGLV
jgi:hypothetical protein